MDTPAARPSLGSASPAPPVGSFSCGVPQTYDRIVLGHGSGGRLSAELLEHLFLPAWNSPTLQVLEDQAILELPPGKLALTTDSFVVNPLFFPGGDIGRLAVHGTVNDLAVGGAQPLYLAAAFILEEGLPLELLRRIVNSMQEACQQAGVTLVTGDTKVVDRGKGDQVFITTTGVGIVPAGRQLSIAAARPGDKVLVSGDLGDHGIAVLSVREGLSFETEIQSDTAPLADLARVMLEACPRIRALRDPTRGGLAATMNELAAASRVGVELVEASLPVKEAVASACELLGLDPLYVANEGKLVAIAPAEEAVDLLAVMRRHPQGARAALIGEITEQTPGLVTLHTASGGRRVVSLLAGEQLPRIC